MNFNVCFSSVCWVWISDKEWMNFQGIFSYVYRGVNFWLITDEYQGLFFYLFTGCEFLTKNGWISRYIFHIFIGCEFCILYTPPWIPGGIHESTWSPCGLQQILHIWWLCYGLHMQTPWMPTGIQMESKRKHLIYNLLPRATGSVYLYLCKHVTRLGQVLTTSGPITVTL